MLFENRIFHLVKYRPYQSIQSIHFIRHLLMRIIFKKIQSIITATIVKWRLNKLLTSWITMFLVDIVT